MTRVLLEESGVAKDNIVAGWEGGCCDDAWIGAWLIAKTQPGQGQEEGLEVGDLLLAGGGARLDKLCGEHSG